MGRMSSAIPNSSFKIFLTIKRYNAKPFSPPKTHDTTGAQLDNQATLFTFSTSSINQNWHNNEWTENYETEVYMSFLQILVSTTELKSTTKCRFCKDNYLKTCSIGCKIETDQKIWILLARSASRLSLSQHLNAYYLILYLFSQNVGGGGLSPQPLPLRWPCVKDLQCWGMFQSCIWLSRSCVRISSSYLGHLWCNASVNSTCAQPPPPPGLTPLQLQGIYV